MKRTSLSGREFSGKILLFGEHSVIDGSKALVVPFDRFKARLTFERSPSEEITARLSNQQLGRLADYVKNTNVPIDHDELRADLEQGLWLRSAIPERYGLGSSGALCAAIYNEYHQFPEQQKNEGIHEVQARLASMESFFHGRSSGIDPLCVYLHSPVLAKGTRRPSVWRPSGKNPAGLRTFLMDTGIAGNTGDQVRLFREKLDHPGFLNEYQERYIPQVDRIVQTYTNGRITFTALLNLSALQLKVFAEIIPERYLAVWKRGIDTGHYALKLCGSGGGGFLLGFTENMTDIHQIMGGRRWMEFKM